MGFTDAEHVNSKSLVIIGCFDTKAEDFAYLNSCLVDKNIELLTINIGVLGSTDLFPVHVEADVVAKAGDFDIETLRSNRNRGEAIKIMGDGASKILARLLTEKNIKGVIGMGGGGGTYMTLAAMQTVPFGIPKVCLSTLATKDLSEKIGNKDIVLIPSIVDVAGLNQISRVMIRQAAGAIIGMMDINVQDDENVKGSIAISIFGNTTIAANRCSDLLRSEGYDVLAFHAVGTGGKTMESLIGDGVFDAVLDLTTTELADYLCGGICSAGPDRLTAASKMGIPQVIVPGCCDIVNFGAPNTVPEKYKDRQLFSWAPDVTLMRTNATENKILGSTMAEKLNQAKAPVSILLPLGGLSKIGAEGEAFHSPEIDRVLFDALRSNLKGSIKILEIDANIDTKTFADRAVEVMMGLIRK